MPKGHTARKITGPHWRLTGWVHDSTGQQCVISGEAYATLVDAVQGARRAIARLPQLAQSSSAKSFTIQLLKKDR